MSQDDKSKKGGMTVAEAGRKGGETVARERGRAFYEEIGRKGGETVARERGREFYEEIGRKGGRKVRDLIAAGQAAMAAARDGVKTGVTEDAVKTGVSDTSYVEPDVTAEKQKKGGMVDKTKTGD